MKKIFLAAAIFSFLFAAAQQKEILGKSKNTELVIALPNKYNTDKQISPKAELLNVYANGNKVYILPQDKMPCVVPDMSQFKMPNAFSSKDYAVKIPNAVIPYQIIPDEKKKRLPDSNLIEKDR